LHYETAAIGEVLSYTPNDFASVWPYKYTEYLEYINAEAAWGVTKGDPNVVVGVTDTYIETTHPDLQGKIAQVGYNNYNYYPADPKHGTQISGLIAAATDNNNGTAPFGYYPSIGFNCRLDFIGSMSTADMLTLSKRNRKILNASWRNSSPTPNLILSGNEQELYQEIYENGTLACVAAGNGHGAPWNYVYPSSYDYVFSTTGIRYGNPTAGWHDDGTDTMNTHQHNPRVDIAAPGIGVGGITYDLSDTTGLWKWQTWDGCWGTSCVSPLTAGTAALILSEDPCYTPYQLEYILKTTANNIYSIS
jgi:subtilisin family serine protease